ncbi:MAG: PilZ domain-containing protein [Candidatus Omnitrophica bacterium]|nr:PilZ domain-containing protein [Candidatus Omnitrophota bacterium]
MARENQADKRNFVRFLISIPLKYAKIGIDKFVSACTHDISAEGIGLITAEELPVNTLLNLCLNIPDNGEEIPLEAEVIWSQEINSNQYRNGLRLKNSRLKPIPLVLRTINSRL